MTHLLEVNNLRCWLTLNHSTIRAIDAVSLKIARGETLVLLGESGCGKSMTALAIAQLLPLSARIGRESSVRLQGEELLDLAPLAMQKVRGKKIAMIFQEPMTSLNPVLTVEQQLQECLVVHTALPKRERKQRCLDLLTRVGLPDPVRQLQQYPHELSGGMKQRVMIAIALAGEPELLIADEPTTALDVTLQAQILDLLKSLQQERNMGMLLITHDLGVAAKMADTIAVMYAGHLVEQGVAGEVLKNPAHPYSKALVGALPQAVRRGQRLAAIPGQVAALDHEYQLCRFADRCQVKDELCQVVQPPWHTLRGEHTARCHYVDLPSHPRAGGEPWQGLTCDEELMDPRIRGDDKKISVMDILRLKVDHLNVSYPIRGGLLRRTVSHHLAVKNLSLQIRTGKTLALVGESGSGKTSVAKAIMRLYEPDSGTIVVDGTRFDLAHGAELRQLKRSIQIVFQDPFTSLDPRMSVANIIGEALHNHPEYVARNRKNERIDELLWQVGLSHQHRDRYPHEFSGGQRQRISIARALAVEPSVLILDEPTSALDLSVQAQVLNLLHDLQAKLGLAYLFITHNISLVAYLADEVMVMRHGEVVEQGATNTVLKYPKHEYTQRLLAAVLATSLRGEAQPRRGNP